MARFQLEPGPIPLHHQVFRDLKAALDAQEWAPGERMPTVRLSVPQAIAVGAKDPGWNRL